VEAEPEHLLPVDGPDSSPSLDRKRTAVLRSPISLRGEYYVAAVDWLQGTEGFGEWQDPAFLKSIAPRARRVTLADGQMAAVTPRLIIR
jgi:hypothetical protein